MRNVFSVLSELFFSFTEFEKSNHDNQCLGESRMGGLQAEMESRGIWWGGHPACTIGAYLAP